MTREVIEQLPNEATAGGVLDHSRLTMAELRRHVPYYVLRLMSGAHEFRPWGEDCVELRSNGTLFILSRPGFEAIKRVHEATAKLLSLHGIRTALNTEDVIAIEETADKLARAEFEAPPERLRVLFLRQFEDGCSFYRIIQPVAFLRAREDTPLEVEESNHINVRAGSNFDIIVAPRSLGPGQMGIMQALSELGKLIVYETDDLLSDLPDWNPAKVRNPKADDMRRQELIRRADGCIVSTEELRNDLGRRDVTHVVHNGINPDLWPMVAARQDTGCVRILWAGGDSHEGDLRLVIKPIVEIIKRYKERVKFIFVGYLPNAFKCAYQEAGVVKTGVAPQFQKFIEFVPGCSVFEWPRLLTEQRCQMAIAPLKPHRFNECKSELKVLEAWALGIPIIASRIAPYQRAITHNVDGVLTLESEGVWELDLDRMIARPDLRERMAEEGLAALKRKGYLMPDVALVMEKALLTIARGKVSRPECNAAIEKRLQELG